jgi:hypothetical protein
MREGLFVVKKPTEEERTERQRKEILAAIRNLDWVEAARINLQISTSQLVEIFAEPGERLTAKQFPNRAGAIQKLILEVLAKG